MTGTPVSLHPLSILRFINPHRLFFKIEILWREGKQLAIPNSGPVQHFKSVIRSGLAHHSLSMFQILFLCPELHFLRNLFSHAPR